MDNITNIAEKLKNAPEGFKLYSPIFEEVFLYKVDKGGIYVSKKSFVDNHYFNRYGQYYGNIGECLLFPSKEVRDWSNFSIKKEEEYNFKPFDKVIVRDDKLDTWTIDFFSYKDETCKESPYTTINGWFAYCLPYNDETAKLIGTTDDYEN